MLYESAAVGDVPFCTISEDVHGKLLFAVFVTLLSDELHVVGGTITRTEKAGVRRVPLG